MGVVFHFVVTAITILIDRRKTLGDLKKRLEAIVLVPAMEFKVVPLLCPGVCYAYVCGFGVCVVSP